MNIFSLVLLLCTLKVLQKLMDISSIGVHYVIQSSLYLSSYKTQNTQLFLIQQRYAYMSLVELT